MEGKLLGQTHESTDGSPNKCRGINMYFRANLPRSCLGLLRDCSESALGHVREKGLFLGHFSDKSRRRPGEVSYLSQKKHAYFLTLLL